MSSDLHELAAPYALDALDADERERFERHLAECERCSAQLVELQKAAGALAFAFEGPAPPPSLRGRILEAARAESGGKVVAFPRRRWALPAVATLAAVAACIAVGLGIWATSLSNSLDRERSAVDQARRAQSLDAAAIHTLLKGDGLQTPISGYSNNGVLSVTPYRYAVLVICDPLQAPQGKTFEVWVIQREKPRSAGLFTGAEGNCVVFRVKGHVPKGATVAVTIERAGGVDKPTTPILYRAQAA
jgi:anti-sigma-K factor RskA